MISIVRYFYSTVIFVCVLLEGHFSIIVYPQTHLQPSGVMKFNFDTRKTNVTKLVPSYPPWGTEYFSKAKKTSKPKPDLYTKDLKPSPNAHLAVSALYGVFDTTESPKLESKIFQGHVNSEKAQQEHDVIDNLVTDEHNSGSNLYSSLDADYVYDIYNGNGHQGNFNQNSQINSDYNYNNDNIYQQKLLTVTETRHLTSYVTTSVISTSYNYVTQYTTQFVPTHVPTYVTNYVTKFATAFVTQKFPVYETKFVTEYHTQIHTLTETYTDFFTTTTTDYTTNYITQTESLQYTTTDLSYVTDYVTKTEYVTEIDYVTDTVYLTTTEALYTTFTSYRDIPYLTTTTKFDSVYFTQTQQVSYAVTSTVWQPQYITKYVTITAQGQTYTTNPLHHYYAGALAHAQPYYQTTAVPGQWYSQY